jgi:hypothetical protein
MDMFDLMKANPDIDIEFGLDAEEFSFLEDVHVGLMFRSVIPTADAPKEAGPDTVYRMMVLDYRDVKDGPDGEAKKLQLILPPSVYKDMLGGLLQAMNIPGRCTCGQVHPEEEGDGEGSSNG